MWEDDVKLKRIWTIFMFFCFGALLFPLAAVEGKEIGKVKNTVDRNTPIQITSNRMNAYDEKSMVVFEGNAIAKQGERTIRAETINIYYKKKKDDTGKQNAEDIQQSGDLEKIEARGNVRMTQGERIVTGNEATYLHDAQQVIIRGNAVLQEGKNVIRGRRVVVFLDENRGVVEGTSTERVSATIFPSETKKKP
jgi:lipopolysaccharide export system protein LptA